MAKDNLGVEIQASLDKNQSRNNIFNDIKSLEKTPFFIRLIAKLYKSLSKVNIENDIKALEKSAPSIRLNGRLNRATTRRNIRNDADSLGNIANVTLGAQIDRNELQQSVDTARDDIEQNLQNNPINVPININGNINNGTQQVQNLNNQMRNANGILGNYLTARDIFRAVTSAIKEAVDEVEKLNKAQTDLQIATSKSSSEMKSLMQDYNQLAIEMSSTTLDVTGEVTVQYPNGTYFINDNDNPFSINTIGIRKKVIQSDNCLTDDDCYNKALWECYYNTEFRETTSIVISDNCVPLFLSTNGMTEAWSVGSCCEYTSIITGETNLYIINKVDHNLADGTYSIDMQRFRPLISEPAYIEPSYPEGTPDSEKDPYDPEWGKYDIKTPVVSVDYGDNGLVTFICNNEDYTEFTLFKFWEVKNGQEVFIGETCTEDGNLNKVFNYKFEDNGTYTIKVGGYSPYYPPSAKSDVSVVISNIGV